MSHVMPGVQIMSNRFSFNFSQGPSLVKNPCLHFRKDRWMLARELLCSQGFPMASGAPEQPTCSFHVSREGLGLPPRRRHSMLHQAGNTINVTVFGALTAWRLAMVRTVKASPLVRAALIAEQAKRRRIS